MLSVQINNVTKWKGEIYMFSVSSQGTCKGDLFTVYVTLMDSANYPPPISRYTVFDVDVKFIGTESEDNKTKIELKDFEFYLMSSNKIFNRIDLSGNTDIQNYIKETNLSNTFFGNASIGYCENQTILILFDKIEEIHYKQASLVFYYTPYENLTIIPLSY